MKIGISSACLYPMPTEEAVFEVLSQGSRSIEIFLSSPSEVDASFISDIKSVCDREGAEVASLHPWSSAIEPFFFFSGYSRRVDDGIELYKKYFEAANIVGAQNIVFHGDRKGGKCSDRRYFEVFGKLSDVAKSFDITLAQENVGYCKSGDPEFISKLKKAVPDTKFVLDIKQCRRADINPFDMADAMGDSIVELHLSDHNDEHSCMLPGRGKFDFSKFFDKLKEQGVYNIPALIELYRDNYNKESELKEAMQYLNNML